MAKPDIQLGPGDTAPITRLQLFEPDNPDGSPGDPLNLQNANLTFKTVVFKYQIRDKSTPPVSRTPTILQTSPTDATRGWIQIDWLETGGAVTPPGSNHRARAIVTDNGNHQETFPNGENIELPDGTNPSWLWMQVSEDFGS